uniref:Transcription repressor n=1 Tax=Triticum urartu TaxID=4572 RepID=A0A8R7UUQ7_TRIUA
TTTDTLTSASSSSLLWEDAVAEFDCGDDGHFKRESSAATQSFSGLLRELNELEQSVVSWGRKSHRSRDKKASTPPLEHNVAVVKQSEDPLSDFRQSMVQMIVENGIIAGEELRQMLRRFLTLNAPHHHDVILRAFAEIWEAVFAASYVPAPATAPPHKHTRREEPAAGRPPMPPRTPPRHHHSPSPSAWRV